MNNKQNILLAFYGDDFTGSTDALEFITRAGAKAILFTEVPTQEQLSKFPELNVYGVAGKTRSLSPAAIEESLLPAFEEMGKSGAKQVHYKVCSTFDSSSNIGSIGKAIDCGATVFNNEVLPVLGGMPALGRFCAFGNLFAKMGIGSEGKIYRLDRHPSMSKHPSTPMNESDLRVHLSKQTNKEIGLIDITMLKNEITDWKTDHTVMLLDALSDIHLEKIGDWLNYLQKDKPLFSVGSSGIEMALGKYWNKNGMLQPASSFREITSAAPLLVMSGSCSPVTRQQISFAKKNGFEEVIIDALRICNDEMIADDVLDEVNIQLSKGRNVIVHTGDKQATNLSAEKTGTALGTIARMATENNNVKRVIISGGDTSSYAARAMEIEAVEMITPVVIGAPLCKAYSANEKINGLEMNFKGGQVGDEKYFLRMTGLI